MLQSICLYSNSHLLDSQHLYNCGNQCFGLHTCNYTLDYNKRKEDTKEDISDYIPLPHIDRG